MAYPMVGNLLFEQRQEMLAKYYEEWVASLPPAERNSLLKECDEYNLALLEQGALLTDPFGDEQDDSNVPLYNSLLNLRADGAMGSVEIPGITGNLMIYHGTEEDVLQKGVGHLRGSSMPVGGTGTHAVLSAHSGLSRLKLFTDIDKLERGDVFYLHILGETLAYQVDKITVVRPTEANDLRIVPDEDYVTLLTCTPYGVNSHRLLVRGTRIPYEEAKQIEEGQMKTGSTWREKYVKAFIIGAGAIGAMVLFILMLRRNKRRKR